MNVNRSLTQKSREHLRESLALQYTVVVPYMSARAHRDTAKLLPDHDAANQLWMAILQRRKDQAALRLGVR